MNISEHINTNGLSREAICTEAMISRTFLSLIESGARRPGLQTVGKLAKALGVSVYDLRPDLEEIFGDAA